MDRVDWHLAFSACAASVVASARHSRSPPDSNLPHQVQILAMLEASGWCSLGRSLYRNHRGRGTAETTHVDRERQ